MIGILILISMLVSGSLLFFLGWKIWKKEQITLIKSYYHKNVAELDKKPYTEKMGIAIILIGIGNYIIGIVNFISNSVYGYGFIALLCYVGGLIIFLFAQIKYNHRIF